VCTRHTFLENNAVNFFYTFVNTQILLLFRISGSDDANEARSLLAYQGANLLHVNFEEKRAASFFISEDTVKTEAGKPFETPETIYQSTRRLMWER
jgi:hypothetical protein